ncbi:MAG: hypothetical protein H6Q13_509 [Bacteroidetes bacterium]|nr:hypothetical protein [Bacteroidota bacterium]
MKRISYLNLALISVLISSCNGDDAALPDNTVNLSATELGLEDTESSKEFTVNIDRSSTTATTVVFDVSTSDLTYDTDFTTTPAISNNQLSVVIPAGETSATVVVTKQEDALFDGDETLTFTFKSVSTGIVQGSKLSLALSFSAIVSEGEELTLNGGEGGSSAVNSVFVDFSNNEQTSVARKSWNLGFYSGDDFAVILNNTTSSTAMKVDNLSVSDIISSTDSATYAAQIALNYTDKFAYLDDLNGDLSETVIKEGNVYVVNLGESQTPLYKVKVTEKDADTYTLQYAKSNEAVVTTIEVAKDTSYNFVYTSFAEGKVVSVEPAKAKWDIEWTKNISSASTGTSSIPYSISDFVLINSRAGTTVATVTISSEVTYENFALANLSTVEFSSDMNHIGSTWRSTNPATGVKTDRFYVIQDSAGNAYKLRFLKMGVADDGTRGYPQIEYALLK